MQLWHSKLCLRIIHIPGGTANIYNMACMLTGVFRRFTKGNRKPSGGIRNITKACFKRKSGILNFPNRARKLTGGFRRFTKGTWKLPGGIRKVTNTTRKVLGGIPNFTNRKLKILRDFVVLIEIIGENVIHLKQFSVLCGHPLPWRWVECVSCKKQNQIKPDSEDYDLKKGEKGTTSFGLAKDNYSSKSEVLFNEDFGDSVRWTYFATWFRVLSASFSRMLWT